MSVKNINKSDGVTLLSLVVTIVMLAILTGVAIKTVTGDNGLISRTKKEKNESIQTYQNEEDEINEMKNELKVESK